MNDQPRALRPQPTQSALAARARTAVDCADVALLTTYARAPHSARTTTAAVRARPDGTVEVLLAPSSPAVHDLLARPVATVRLAPAGCLPVLLHGAARRLRGVERDGRLVFHVQVASVRVGRAAELVDEASYTSAEPDPLRHEAPGVLAHLNAGHAAALAQCLQARGIDAEIACATGLDAHGLTVVGIGRTGVEEVRLAFAEPVSDLSQLPAGLHAALAPGCSCEHRSAPRPPDAVG